MATLIKILLQCDYAYIAIRVQGNVAKKRTGKTIDHEDSNTLLLHFYCALLVSDTIRVVLGQKSPSTGIGVLGTHVVITNVYMY